MFILRLYMLCAMCLSAAGTLLAQASLSPLNYGWHDARTDVERYQVLFDTHWHAVKQGVGVDYAGIDTANIEIGAGCPVLPLADDNDFGGVVINVRNTSRHNYIFRHAGKTESVSLTGRQIDSGDFRSIPQLASGEYMLIIYDDNAWGERTGYTDKVERRDILHIKDGRALNHVVMPYSNSQSRPVCRYVPLRQRPLSVRNLTVNRQAGDAFMTYVIDVRSADSVIIDNVTINTPRTGFHGDMAIRLYDCMHVTLSRITVNGSYSQKGKWGYGFSLNNVYDLKASRLHAYAPWGVFGNNNINTAHLQDCDLNRWDIHSYGRDITMSRCTFRGMYNQYSSVYGTVLYDSCTFVEHVAYLQESSYTASVPVTIRLVDCTFIATSDYARLGSVKLPSGRISSRRELQKVYKPMFELNNVSWQSNLQVRDRHTLKRMKTSDINIINAPIRSLF